MIAVAEIEIEQRTARVPSNQPAPLPGDVE